MESHAHLQKDLQGKIVTVEHMEKAKPKQLLKTNHYTTPSKPSNPNYPNPERNLDYGAQEPGIIPPIKLIPP